MIATLSKFEMLSHFQLYINFGRGDSFEDFKFYGSSLRNNSSLWDYPCQFYIESANTLIKRISIKI